MTSSSLAWNMPPVDDALVRAFAPQGVLRGCINLGNPLLAQRDPDGGLPTGVSVDLAQTLAQSLGVPLQLVVVEKAAQSVEAVRTGRADVGFFAIDPARSEGMAFSAPYLLIEGSYLVRTDSTLADNAQVDRPGQRVAVSVGSAYDLFLSREIKAASIERLANADAVLDALRTGQVEVAAGIRQLLQDWSEQQAGLRMLPGRFMVIEQAMGLLAERGEPAAHWLRAFVGQTLSSGWVAQALVRHRVQGAVAAAT